jgi:hypothetical protein
MHFGKKNLGLRNGGLKKPSSKVLWLKLGKAQMEEKLSLTNGNTKLGPLEG